MWLWLRIRFAWIRSASRVISSPWPTVGTLARLTVLTRASYTMLLFVPVFAALWPSIDRTIQSFEAQFSMEAEKLSLVAEKLNRKASSIGDGKEIEHQISAIYEVAQEFKERQSIAREGHARMPKVWLYAFLASLFAVVAQTIFQVFCERSVREAGKEEFISAQLKSMHDHPDLHVLATMAAKMHLMDFEIVNLVKLLGREVFESTFVAAWVDKHTDDIDDNWEASEERGRLKEKYWRLAGEVDMGVPYDRVAFQNKIVRAAAKAEFEVSCQNSRFAGTISLALYVCAILLLFLIIGGQTFSVISATL